MGGAIVYSQFEFQTTSTERCFQFADTSDYKTQQVRDGNYIHTREIYHIYDVCKFQNGTESRNVSLGYRTEDEMISYGFGLDRCW